MNTPFYSGGGSTGHYHREVPGLHRAPRLRLNAAADEMFLGVCLGEWKPVVTTPPPLVPHIIFLKHVLGLFTWWDFPMVLGYCTVLKHLTQHIVRFFDWWDGCPLP